MGTYTTGTKLYKPANGESGWDDEANTNFDRLSEFGVNVKSYGAVGDGLADDTAAIQAAIDAASDGDVLFFPRGHWVFSTLSITKSLTFAGVGFWNNANVAFGNAAWAGSQYGTNFGGTVLRSTNTASRAILAATSGKRLNVQDLMLLGPGSGTSNGFELGTAAIPQDGMDWSNVLVANFGGAGYRMLFCVSNAFHDLKARGCKSGLSLSDTTNENHFFRTEVQFSDTDAVLLTTDTQLNMFNGGLIQNCTGDGFDVSGVGNHLRGFYFENSGITKAAKFVGGGDHSLTHSYMSTADEDIDINVPYCTVGPLRHGVGGYIITLGTAADIQLIYPSGATIVDNGNFYTGPTGRAKTQVVATASLPAANAAWNGFVLIEDAGAGDRNLIIYAGAQRFRIDGGAAF